MRKFAHDNPVLRTFFDVKVQRLAVWRMASIDTMSEKVG